ncbi:MAG: hypothetical protein JNM07_03495 [Phycisphaerae bacterium]|nr:hypothetical protein [Phycisphaerae bacterium]
MRLSDIVSSLGLAVYPIIGMLLMLSVYIGALLRVTGRNAERDLEPAALLPLADDAPRGRGASSEGAGLSRGCAAANRLGAMGAPPSELQP